MRLTELKKVHDNLFDVWLNTPKINANMEDHLVSTLDEFHKSKAS